MCHVLADTQTIPKDILVWKNVRSELKIFEFSRWIK